MGVTKWKLKDFGVVLVVRMPFIVSLNSFCRETI